MTDVAALSGEAAAEQFLPAGIESFADGDVDRLRTQLPSRGSVPLEEHRGWCAADIYAGEES